MSRELSEVEVMHRFRELVGSYESQRACAAAFAVTESYISKLLLGDRWIPERFLEAMGIEREERTQFIYKEIE